MAADESAVHIGKQMIDVGQPKVVEIQIGASGETIWVNVDGVCRFRAQGIDSLTLIDNRRRVPRFTAVEDTARKD